MTQSVVPFFHTPLNAPEFLNLWRSVHRSGVVRDSQVTVGGSGWKVTVKAGEVIIDGSWIYDDLDKIDGLDLGHIGGDRHYVVYQTYAYAQSDPPATSVFAVTAAVTPPTQPTIPAGAVKLADIFVPTGAASIGTLATGGPTDPIQVTTTGVRIVQAPRLWPVEDTGELMDRLIMAVGNTMIYTQGSINYDDALGKLYLSQAVVVQSLCSTHRQLHNNAPALVRATVPAEPAGLDVPGVAGTRDVVIYTLIDRSSPNDSASAEIKFLDRDDPADDELNELLNYTSSTQILILGVIVGDKLFMPGVQGQLPIPDADTRKYLNNDPAGAHTWDLLTDALMVGGHHAGLADSTARDAIAADLRRQGMIAYVVADDTFYALIGGVANGNYAALQDDSRHVGGLKVAVADTTARDAIAAARRKQGMIVYVVADDAYYALIGGVTNGDWARIEHDSRLVGGFRVVANAAARLAIALNRQVVDMLVMQADTNEVYRLTATGGPPTYQYAFTLPSASTVQIDATLSTQGFAVFQDVTGDPGSVNEIGDTINARSAVFARAHADARVRIVLGSELLPDTESLIPDFGPAMIVKPGTIIFTNGIKVSHGSDLQADGTASRIGGGAVPAGPANMYVYVRNKDESGDPASSELRWSPLPPDEFGNPTDGGVDATYVKEDYAYVGMLRYLDNSAGDWEGVWGKFAVAHVGIGMRELSFDPDDSALNGSDNDNLTSGGSATHVLGPATNLSTLFPTAKQIIARVITAGASKAGEITTIKATGIGVYLFPSMNGTAGANINFNESVLARFPNHAGRIRLAVVTSGGYSGSLSVTSEARLLGVVENLNDPLPEEQGTFVP